MLSETASRVGVSRLSTNQIPADNGRANQITALQCHFEKSVSSSEQTARRIENSSMNISGCYFIMKFQMFSFSDLKINIAYKRI